MMTEEILKGLSSPDSEDQQNSIYLIGYIFEKYNGYKGDDIPALLEGVNINENMVDSLKKSLVDYSYLDIDETNRSSLFNALRKTRDEKLKKYFLSELEKEIEKSAGVLFQIMLALHDIGEDCFAGRQSLSILDEEENIADAKAYLKKQGQY